MIETMRVDCRVESVTHPAMPRVKIARWVQAQPRLFFAREFGCPAGKIEGVRHYFLLWLDTYQQPIASYTEALSLFKQAIDCRYDRLPVW